MVSATVSPPWTYTLQLPRDPRAPGVARAILRTALRAHGMPGLAETAELLASELVTNAYLHAPGPYSLRLRQAGPDRVRLAVRDTSAHIPAPFRWSAEAPAELAERGRGLYLVVLYAESWGVVPLPGRALPGRGLPGRGLPGQGGKLLWVECVSKGDEVRREETRREETRRGGTRRGEETQGGAVAGEGEITSGPG